MRLNEATESTFMQISITIYVTAISGGQARTPTVTVGGSISLTENQKCFWEIDDVFQK